MRRGHFSSRVNAKRVIICRVEEGVASVWEIIIASFHFVEIATRDCREGRARGIRIVTGDSHTRIIIQVWRNFRGVSARIARVGAVNQFTMRIKGYRATGGDGGSGDGTGVGEGEEEWTRVIAVDDRCWLQKRAESIRFSREALKLSRVKYTEQEDRSS